MSRVESTPTKEKKPKGLFTNDVRDDEIQARSPRHSVSETDNSEGIRLRPGSARRGMRRVAAAAASKAAGKEIAGLQLEAKGEQPKPQVAEPSSATVAIEALRHALSTVDNTEMTSAEIASIEDEVFEAFSRLRERRMKGLK